MKEEVMSITEAYSMQPACFAVGAKSSGRIIASITLEKINHPINGDPMEYDYYVGRSVEGVKLFQYKAETVNVNFKHSAK